MRQDLENLREGATEGIFKYFTFRAIAFCLSLDDVSENPASYGRQIRGGYSSLLNANDFQLRGRRSRDSNLSRGEVGRTLRHHDVGFADAVGVRHDTDYLETQTLIKRVRMSTEILDILNSGPKIIV